MLCEFYFAPTPNHRSNASDQYNAVKEIFIVEYSRRSKQSDQL